MASRGQTITIEYYAWDTAANVYKTGDVANHTLRWTKDGTASAPTNSPAEVDATNKPGAYKLVLTGTEATCDIGILGGKSSTANIVLAPTHVSFEQLPTAAPDAAGGLPISDAGSLYLDGMAVALAIITGIDGATLATLQGNYAPSKPGDDMGLTATATSAQLVDDIADEPYTKATHDVPNSFARRLRALSDIVIRRDTAQGPGTGNNQIQLDTGASSTDGAYDPSIISIVDGTGAGQSRLVLQYDGATRTATVDRNWKVNPDTTSEYTIFSDAGREHVNEGLAQGGTTISITLNALASSDDGAYVGQTVFVRSGTGEDQAGLVNAYNGTTKVATIAETWAVTPDSTSAYVMLPTSLHDDAKIDSILEDTGTTLPALIDDLAIKKNTAGLLHIEMVLASDHVTPATGLTVTAQRLIDSGVYVNVAGAMTEVSNGAYRFDYLAADSNGDVITWKFSAGTADDTKITFKTVA